jgi:hypothetical protein
MENERETVKRSASYQNRNIFFLKKKLIMERKEQEELENVSDIQYSQKYNLERKEPPLPFFPFPFVNFGLPELGLWFALPVQIMKFPPPSRRRKTPVGCRVRAKGL